MKKLVSLCLAATFLLGLFACGHDETAAPPPEGKPIRTTRYDADGNLDFSTTYEYDSKGEILRSEQRRVVDGDPITTTFKNRYNRKGQLVRVDSDSSYGYMGFKTYEYNIDGQLVGTNFTDFYGSGDWGSRTTYTYNPQGQLIQTYSEINEPSTQMDVYEYDAEGALSRMNTNDRGTIGYYLFEYDAQGLLSRKTYYENRFESDIAELRYYEIYKY